MRKANYGAQTWYGVIIHQQVGPPGWQIMADGDNVHHPPHKSYAYPTKVRVKVYRHNQYNRLTSFCAICNISGHYIGGVGVGLYPFRNNII